MARMTPPLLTKGRYTLVNPFVAEDTVLYTCTALRTFAECEVAGENVLQDVYLKHNLTEREYNRDLDAGALLVTLMSETQPPIFVPDTYIESYPNLSDVVYNHVVLTVSLGSVPDFLNFDFLKAQMAALVCPERRDTTVSRRHWEKLALFRPRPNRPRSGSSRVASGFLLPGRIAATSSSSVMPSPSSTIAM